MAILDVQFRRGSVSYGRSTTFDAEEEFVLRLLHSFAKNLQEETGELVAPLVGTVRRPSRDAYLHRLERELDVGGHGLVLQVSDGWSIGGGPRPVLVVVLAGRGELTGEHLDVGDFAFFPSAHDDYLKAIDGDLEVLQMEVT